MGADFYRQKLYNAERRAFRDFPRVDGRTLEDVKVRLDQMVHDSPAFTTACLKAGRVAVVPEVVCGGKSRTSWAMSSLWRLKITKNHRAVDWVLVHELAHLPTPSAFQAHGREFCALYLAMVEDLLGPEWAGRLRTELEVGKVPFERTAKYVRQLRGYFRLLANPDYESQDITVIMTNGARVYCRPRLEGDIVYLDRGYREGTPDSVPLDEVAYVTWQKVTDHRKWLDQEYGRSYWR